MFGQLQRLGATPGGATSTRTTHRHGSLTSNAGCERDCWRASRSASLAGDEDTTPPCGRSASALTAAAAAAAAAVTAATTTPRTCSSFSEGTSLLDLPRTPSAFLQPLLLHANSIASSAHNSSSSRTADYLSMLRESTTSSGQMQRHLLRMFARAMLDTAKVARVVQDPGSGLSDFCVDTGCTMWLQHLKSQEAMATAADENDDGSAHAHARACAAAASPDGPLSPPPSSSSSAAAASPTAGVAGWRRLRLRLLGASCFKQARGTKDDACVRGAGGGAGAAASTEVSPLHAKALSLLLSVVLSASTGHLADCLASSSSASVGPEQHSNTTMLTSSSSQAVAISTGKAVLSGMLQAPPPLASHASAGGGLASHGSAAAAATFASHLSSGLASHASGAATTFVSHISGGLATHGSAAAAATTVASHLTGGLASHASGTAATDAAGLGGAAANALRAVTRSSSKGAKLAAQAGSHASAADSWASASVDAASSVLEVFVESMEAVAKEGRGAAASGAACGHGRSRAVSVPGCLQPPAQPQVEEEPSAQVFSKSGRR